MNSKRKDTPTYTYKPMKHLTTGTHTLRLQKGTSELLLIDGVGVTLTVEQEEDTSLVIYCSTLQGTGENHINILQLGNNASTELRGKVVLHGTDNVANITRITHNAIGGKSNCIFKYVLYDEAKGFFRGDLIIKPDAQKTQASQTNRNILLSDRARMQTLPQLEIYADDVKASHGATTGQMNEDAIFYMQQRCIARQEAEQLLLEAFLMDVTYNENKQE